MAHRSRPKGVVCLLDGDAAGQKAALSYVSIFLKVGLDARFAELPKGSDPDQILMGQGIEKMHKIIKDAQPMVEYVIKQKIPVLKEASPKQKESVCNWMFSAMVEIGSNCPRVIEQLARLLNLPVDALKFDFPNFKNRTPNYKQPLPKKNFHLVSLIV